MHRWVVVLAVVLAIPIGHASAQGPPDGVLVQAAAPVAQEEPADPDLGPSNEAISPAEEAMPGPEDVSPSAATGVNTLDPNAPSPSTTDLPQGGEGGG